MRGMDLTCRQDVYFWYLYVVQIWIPLFTDLVGVYKDE